MKPIENLSGVRIMVVGDVMLDRYWWGLVDRISPEAPVPIVKLTETSLVAGGAANVAANIAGLGAEPVLFGICGDDAESAEMLNVLENAGISERYISKLAGRSTTIKTRIVAHNQHVVRIDRETADPISSDETATILEAIRPVMADVDAIIVSDYAKGLLTEQFLSELFSLARETGRPVIVDPKSADLSRYNGATVITPNKREAAAACSLDAGDPNMVSKAGTMLLQSAEITAVLITEGENGMTLFEKGAAPFHLESWARDVYDVTGAGDTVIATFAAAVASGFSLTESAKYANAAAGLVVGKIGTTRISLDMLNDFLSTSKDDPLFESLHA